MFAVTYFLLSHPLPPPSFPPLFHCVSPFSLREGRGVGRGDRERNYYDICDCGESGERERERERKRGRGREREREIEREREREKGREGEGGSWCALGWNATCLPCAIICGQSHSITGNSFTTGALGSQSIAYTHTHAHTHTHTRRDCVQGSA